MMITLTHRTGAVLTVTALVASCAAAAVLAAPAAGAATPRPAPSALAEGAAHSIALAADGTVRAWGYNVAGELGDNTTTNRTSPTEVRGPGGVGYLSGVVAVAAAAEDSFAVRDDGTVWAWGNNPFGQLGDGSSNNVRHTPVEVLAATGSGHLTGVIAVAAGDYATYALKSDGTVWAWGYGPDGELGNNLGTSTVRPVQVSGIDAVGKLTGVVAIAAGSVHALALRSNGSVVSWGGGTEGQLGLGTFHNNDAPFQVIGEATGVVSVSARGDDSMLLRSDGTVRSWGDDSAGQLGDGTTGVEAAPLAPAGLGAGVVGIAMGTDHAAAVKSDGTVWDWGVNQTGELGIGTLTNSGTPVRVHGLGYGSGVKQVAAGQAQTLALTSTGAVEAWGSNSQGQLGDTSTIDSYEPVRTDGLVKIADPALKLLHAPVISGTAKYRHNLTVSKGTWGLPATAWTYRWLRGGHPISGATKSTYTVHAADRGRRISVRVTASRVGYPAGAPTTASRAIPKR
jgi:alpha-tubulin suppressor-like RCC1 family protein